MAKEKNDYDSHIDDAMNKKGFAEFLARNEITDLNDKEVIEKKMETYEAMGQVKKGLKDLFKQKIQKELGITLEQADMDAVDKHIDDMAFEDPEHLAELNGKIEEQKTLTESIRDSEEKLRKHNKNPFEGKSGLLNKAGFFGYKMVNYLTKPYEWSLQYSKIADSSNLTATKQELFSEIGAITALHDKIKERAAKQMNDMLVSADSSNSLNKLQDKFNTLKQAQSIDGMAIDLLSELDEDAFQEKLDEAIDKKISEEIMETTLNTKLGDNALSQLERSLSKFISVDALGSRNGEDAKEVIHVSLLEASENLPTDIEGQAKRLILLRIIEKIENSNS